MSVIEALLETAYVDTQLLDQMDALGDDPSKSREVGFVLRSREKDKAKTLVSFIQDNQYGIPQLQQPAADDADYQVIITVNMPITQPLLYSVSGLMACLAQIFEVEYEGWNCPALNL